MEQFKEVETVVKKRRNIVKAKKFPSETGFKGIRISPNNVPEKRYTAYITLYNKFKDKTVHFSVGSYPTPEEAHNERIKFIAKLF